MFFLYFPNNVGTLIILTLETAKLFKQGFQLCTLLAPGSLTLQM